MPKSQKFREVRFLAGRQEGKLQVTSSLQITLDVLKSSRNESAVATLVAALDRPDGVVYEGALKALVARRSKAGHLAVLGKWHQLAPHQRELVEEGRGRMSGALRDAVLSDDPQLFANGCELAEQFTEFDLVPTLVTLAENQKSPHAKTATELVLRLVNQLSEMLHGPRDYNDRRDPQAMCRYVLESLERSVERFRQHKRRELVEAFVMLGGPTSGVFRTILDDLHHVCHTIVVNTLSTTESSGVLEVLLEFLQAENTPLTILNIISRRTDDAFVTRLLQLGKEEISPKVCKNLSRIRSFAWLKLKGQSLNHFDAEDQAPCVRLVAASGVKQDELLNLCEELFRTGTPAGRLACCEAVASLQGDRPNRLVIEAAQDNDPAVQASAVRQLRDHHVPNTMALLVKLLDSPHEIVQEASREALSEFSFESYLARYETLSDEVRISTGTLVCKVDLETVPRLLEELKSPSRKKRMRAIEIAEAMGLAPQISSGLLDRLEDEDHMVRAAAADVLQHCPGPSVKAALQQATTDRSVAVQCAAQSSLAVFASLTGPIAIDGMIPTESQV